jgi:hypothetical protein
VTVFAFRGFSTIAELGLHLEMLARYRVLPLAYDVMPLYDAISKRFLSWYAQGLRKFGSRWFTPRPIYAKFMDKAMQSYNKRHLTTESPVLFVGINVGGVFAKDLAMRTGHRGIAFLSMPVSTESFNVATPENVRAKILVRNIFNQGGLFGVDDPQAGVNHAVPGDPDLVAWDNADASFCNLAEKCGYHDQFSAYCTALIGADKLAHIRKYLGLE